MVLPQGRGFHIGKSFYFILRSPWSRPLAIQRRISRIWLFSVYSIGRIPRLATFSSFGRERRRQNLPLSDFEMQKLILSCFGIACILVALNSAAVMFTTFAPADVSAGFAAGESESMERVRNYFAPSVFTASVSLAVAGVWIAVSAWLHNRSPAR